MSVPIQRYLTGRTAARISEEIEEAIRRRSLGPGERLPPVRNLAAALEISPATVASAYRALQARALLVSDGRRGTRVGHRPLPSPRPSVALPPHSFNLADGNPDPALLPDSGKALRSLKYRPQLYGGGTLHAGLVALMRRELERDGIRPGPCCVVNGAMDGIDRLFAEHLRAGDRVAVEDPGFPGHHDLVVARGLALEPVPVDGDGMLPDALARACRARVKAVLCTPRAQSPTGAAFSPERAKDLRRILRAHPEILVIEDDHASFFAHSTPFERVHEPRGRWAHLRSFSKAFNPDLRLALATGDEQTMNRAIDRLAIAERWVSMVLQSLAHALLADSTARRQVARAAGAYDARREALRTALAARGFETVGRSGYNVWLPVVEETPTVQSLARSGWAVAAGERFRLNAPAGIRITAARLLPGDAPRFAAAVSALPFGARSA